MASTGSGVAAGARTSAGGGRGWVVFFEIGDFDVDFHYFIGCAVDRAAGGGGVGEMSAAGESDVPDIRQNSVCGIETFPTDVGNVEFDPSVRGVGHRSILAVVSGVNVAAHVARGKAEEACEADEEVGEILTDALAIDEDFEGGGAKCGAAGDVFVLVKERQVDVEECFHEVVFAVGDERHGVVEEFFELRVGQFDGCR